MTNQKTQDPNRERKIPWVRDANKTVVTALPEKPFLPPAEIKIPLKRVVKPDK